MCFIGTLFAVVLAKLVYLTDRILSFIVRSSNAFDIIDCLTSGDLLR